jgi:hypothetical protein
MKMTTTNMQQVEDGGPQEDQRAQVDLFETYGEMIEEELDLAEDILGEWLDYEEPPLLLVDTDPERAVIRQKELMDYCFDGIGEERKEEKRMGLAMQQLDVEQRHALRLLLIYQDADQLAAHLARCLEDPAYGYGERGDNGRTIAQAMAGVAEGELAVVVAGWLEAHRPFQQSILSGTPMSFRSLFDYADLDSFEPLVQRVGDMTWRLGVEGEGKYRDFQGEAAEIWPQVCDTYVQWVDEDNHKWLADLKRRATRLPDTILRAARADRLRKEIDHLEVEGSRVILTTERGQNDWPQMITMADEKGTALLGLSRLSGHAFYELSWSGGLNVRRFELSNTTRRGVPFEHIEVALRLAETLGEEMDLQPEPVTPLEVEAAYLRRMKATGAELGPPPFARAPTEAIEGQPVAAYVVQDIVATLLHGGQDFAYVTPHSDPETGVLLRRDEGRGVMVAMPVRRGRPRRGGTLMTTPLAELSNSVEWNRSLAAWGAWLVKVSQK